MCQLTNYRSKIIFKQISSSECDGIKQSVAKYRAKEAGQCRKKKESHKNSFSEDREKTTPGKSRFRAMRYPIAPCYSPSRRILPMTSI